MYSALRDEEQELAALPQGGHVLEVIFVSSDRDEKSFAEYYLTMPWVSIPFRESAVAAELSQKHGVSGIPAFIVMNAADGRIVDSDARTTVMNARGDPRKLLKSWKVI